MTTTKKYSFYAIAIFILIGAIFSYKEFIRKPASVAVMHTDVSVDAASLLQAFNNNETLANAKYLGKTIEVKGTISQIDNQADTLINIFLGNDSLLNKVSCIIKAQAWEKYRNIKPGSIHTVKGICTGFLIDVELNRCIIIQ